MPMLAQIRRLEAAGFRAWPSATTFYDGTWSIRLTPKHASRRLNSINPLDPNDHTDLTERIARARERFRLAGKALTFRQTPLASRELEQFLHDENFALLNENAVMSVALADLSFEATIDQLPFKDTTAYASASADIHELSDGDEAALIDVIGSIKASVGLFISEDAAGALSCLICVQDGELAGILDLATRTNARRQGNATQLMMGALKWARARGATTAWLQVELGQDSGERLYKNLGFREVYRYTYRVMQDPA